MERILANWYIYIYETLFTQTRIYDSLTSYSGAIIDALAKGGTLYGIYLGVRTIAFGILTVYFIITLGTRLEGRETSPAVIFRTCLQFFVGYALAFFSFDIVSWIFQIGDWMASTILETTVADNRDFSQFTETFVRSLEDFGFTAKIMYTMKGIFTYLICACCDLVISYSIITRVIRVCVNAALSPIAVANWFEGSRHSDAVRFLKRTLALGLQCSMIMVITAATTNLTGYLASDTAYGADLHAENSIKTAYEEMLETADNDYKSLQSYVSHAVDKKGYSAYVDKELKAEYQNAVQALTSDVSKVTESDELKYKRYEELLGVKVFERSAQDHYIYDAQGYAELNPTYRTFTVDATKNFMDTLLGNGHYWIFILLLVIRTGLIKQSVAFSNTIVAL